MSKELQPNYRTASRNRNKGRNQLVRLAIQLLKQGNYPEALGCLLAFEQKRKSDKDRQAQNEHPLSADFRHGDDCEYTGNM